ncbi:IpaD/SipD/SspD family type III secretion system needle tip protein [Erwinia amylovora]|uniref:IpaD/SipD/SspD family type III secretion system needle tip protein n=1 Tax=Erwinia amylovora TaxID=552 RepID=UPI001443ADAA|nr:IpaD/SipD/SspD family type III secretion system needle tip protein [Erwinia amylovora]
MVEIISPGNQTPPAATEDFSSKTSQCLTYSSSQTVPFFETNSVDNVDTVYESNKELLLRLYDILTRESLEDKLPEIRQLLLELGCSEKLHEFEEINYFMRELQNSYENILNSKKNADYVIAEQKKLTAINSHQIERISSHLRKRSILHDKSSVEPSLPLELTKKGYSAIAGEVFSADEITPGTSYAELWSKIAKAIASIRKDYVEFYATLMKKYTDLYQSYNENVQKASSDAMSAGKDGNNISFNKDVMIKGYNKFKDYAVRIDLGKVAHWDNMSSQERENMKLTIAPAFDVSKDGEIRFNLSQYSTVDGSLPKGDGNQVPTASYHAWLATFNAAGSALQSNMQSFAQRYSQSNSTFDQLNKVLSGVISTLGDSAREVYKSIG